MGRYTIGRRRYSWEKKGKGKVARKTAADPFSGTIFLLFLTYFFMKPVFWVLVALLGFIAACLLVMGAVKFGEWLHKIGLFRRNRGR